MWFSPENKSCLFSTQASHILVGLLTCLTPNALCALGSLSGLNLLETHSNHVLHAGKCRFGMKRHFLHYFEYAGSRYLGCSTNVSNIKNVKNKRLLAPYLQNVGQSLKAQQGKWWFLLESKPCLFHHRLSCITNITDQLSCQMLYVCQVLSVSSTSLKKNQNMFSMLENDNLLLKVALFSTVEMLSWANQGDTLMSAIIQKLQKRGIQLPTCKLYSRN